MSLDSEGLRGLYGHRFGDEGESRNALWRVLCQDFFQMRVPEDSTVLDIAAGYCEFANNIVAARRIALDLNPAVSAHAVPGVETIVSRADDMQAVADDSVDVAFVSNFFEHV